MIPESWFPCFDAGGNINFEAVAGDGASPFSGSLDSGLREVVTASNTIRTVATT